MKILLLQFGPKEIISEEREKSICHRDGLKAFGQYRNVLLDNMEAGVTWIDLLKSEFSGFCETLFVCLLFL